MSPEESSSKDAAVIDDDLVEALGFEPTTAIENVSDLADDGDVADDDGDAALDDGALDDLLDDAVVQDDLAADLLFEPVSDEASDTSGEGTGDGADEAVLDLDGLDGEVEVNGEVEDDLEVADDDVTLASDALESGDLDDDGMALAAASLLGVASVQSIDDDSASDESASDDTALDDSASDDTASDIVDLDLLESEGSETDGSDLDDADAEGSDDGEMTLVDTATDTDTAADNDTDVDPDADVDADAEGSADVDERTEAIELSEDDASVLPPPLFEETIDLTAGDVAVADPEVDVFDLEKVEDEPDVDVDVAAAAATAATVAPTRRRKQLRARKSRRVVRHIDPWSVLTFSVLFHLCFFAAMLLASVLVWNAADAAGTIDNIEEFIIDLGDYDSFEINGDAVFKAAMLIAGMLTLASSIMVVLLTVVFNLISDLVGGIRVTVIEEETVRVVSSGRRK